MEDRAEDRAEARQELKEEAREGVETNEPSTNRATAKPGFQGTAVSQITKARCAREARCGNFGPDKTYASDQDCSAKISEEWRDDLNAYECPGGVVMKELSECLEEIKNEDCAQPFDTLGRIVACRSTDICKAS